MSSSDALVSKSAESVPAAVPAAKYCVLDAPGGDHATWALRGVSPILTIVELVVCVCVCVCEFFCVCVNDDF
jgi:hypothetical protein